MRFTPAERRSLEEGPRPAPRAPLSPIARIPKGQTVQCPVCGAKVGFPCFQSSRSALFPGASHVARIVKEEDAN